MVKLTLLLFFAFEAKGSGTLGRRLWRLSCCGKHDPAGMWPSGGTRGTAVLQSSQESNGTLKGGATNQKFFPPKHELPDVDPSRIHWDSKGRMKVLDIGRAWTPARDSTRRTHVQCTYRNYMNTSSRASQHPAESKAHSFCGFALSYPDNPIQAVPRSVYHAPKMIDHSANAAAWMQAFNKARSPMQRQRKN